MVSVLSPDIRRPPIIRKGTLHTNTHVYCYSYSFYVFINFRYQPRNLADLLHRNKVIFKMLFDCADLPPTQNHEYPWSES